MSGSESLSGDSLAKDKPPDMGQRSRCSARKWDTEAGDSSGSGGKAQVAETTDAMSEDRCSTPKNPVEEKRMNLQSKIARLQHHALMKAASVTTSDSDSEHSLPASRRRMLSEPGSGESDLRNRVSTPGRLDSPSLYPGHANTDDSQDSEASATECDRACVRNEQWQARRKGRPRKKHKYRCVDPLVEELTGSGTADTDSVSLSDQASSPGRRYRLSPVPVSPPPASESANAIAQEVADKETSGDSRSSAVPEFEDSAKTGDDCGKDTNCSGSSVNGEEGKSSSEDISSVNDDDDDNERGNTPREELVKEEDKDPTDQDEESGHDVIDIDCAIQCKKCQKTLANVDRLKDHVQQKHTVLLCKFCTKCFVGSVALYDHVCKAHSDENTNSDPDRPYKCSTCHRGFTSTHLLHSHELIHLEEKPFKCELCPKTFSRKQSLDAHNRAHQGIKPFKCHICNTSFTRRVQLLKHKRHFHPELPDPYGNDIQVSGHDLLLGDAADLPETETGQDSNRLGADVGAREAVANLEENDSGNSTQQTDESISAVKATAGGDVNNTRGNEQMTEKPNRVRAITLVKNEDHVASRNSVDAEVGNEIPHEENPSDIGRLRSQKSELSIVPFRCVVCQILFEDGDALALHKRTHHDEEKPHVCGTCGERFLVTKSLRNHTERYHAMRTCDICNVELEGTENLRIHKNTHEPVDPSKPHQCDVCFKSFASVKALRLHSKIHDANSSFPCDYCSKTFNRRTSLNEHILAHKGERMWTCEVCCKKFTRSSSLRDHIARFHPEFQPSVFSQKGLENLDIDQLLASSSGELENESTEKEIRRSLEMTETVVEETQESEFSVKAELESIGTNGEGTEKDESQELATETEVELKQEDDQIATGNNSRHVCHLCGKRFTRNNSLQLHIQIHTGKRFHCDSCSMRFTTVYEMNRHKKTIHEGERPYGCKLCSEKFVSVSTLRSHMTLIHTAQSCDVCKQEFLGTEALRIHKRTHTPFDPAKPYQCDTCFKKFKKRMALRVHSKIHDPNFVFKCQICPKTFNRKQSLNEHLRGHTGEQLWTCEVCRRKFTRRTSLRDHTMRHHPGVQSQGERATAPQGADGRVVRGETADALVNGAHKESKNGGQRRQSRGRKAIAGVRNNAVKDNATVSDENIAVLKDTRLATPSPNVKNETESLRSDTPVQSERTASSSGSDCPHEKLPFACSLCHFRYASMAELVMHKRMNHHQNQRPYSCKECSETYVDVLSLRNHLDRVHTIQICDICSEQVNGSDALTVHRVSHFTETELLAAEGEVFKTMKPFKCHLCEDSFHSRKTLEEHVSGAHAEKWTCQLCNQNFARKSVTPTRHLRVCRAGKKRPLRGRKRKEQGEEKRIVAALEEGPENDAVSVDGASSILSDALGRTRSANRLRQTRKLSQPAEEDHPEVKRSRITTRATSSAATESKPGPAFQKVFICKHCGKSFSRNGSLVRHIQIHTGKNFPCDQCSMKFAAKYDLTQHKRTVHQGERPHICKKCKQGFRSLQNLKSHVSQVHSEHKCGVCNEVFIGKTVLKVHRNLHVSFDPSKPFRCEQCFKYFRTQGELSLHARIHDPGYTFLCPMCPRTFNRKQSVDEHVRQHEEGKLFSCDVCEKRFTRRTSLRDHVTRLHPEYSTLAADEQSADGLDAVKDENVTPPPDLAEVDESESEDVVNVEPKVADAVSLEGIPFINSDSTADDVDDKSGKDELKCSICNETFRRKDALNAHELMHVHQGPFKCADCGKEFKRREQFRTHLLMHKRSGECQAECLQCGSEFNSPAALKRHLLTHRGAKPHQCEICSKRFALPYELRKHKRSVHLGLKDYCCGICKRRFTSSQGLRSHEKYAHGRGGPLKRFQCSICCKEFVTKARMTTHMRCHSGEKPYQCTICNQRFRIKINLDRHAFLHDPSKRFNCEHCDKFFSRKGHQLVHMAKAHDVKIYRCPYCPFDRYFATLEELQSHKKDYHPLQLMSEEPNFHLPWEKKTKVYEFKCDLCPKSFSSKTNLLHHHRIHTGDRPFACDMCGHRSVSKSSLKTHYETHTDRKPFACEFCDKAFGREWVLKRHIVTRHTNFERPHKCGQCDKAFRLPMELKQHIFKVHSGTRERIHECAICRKRFFEIQQLGEHFSTHESDGEFCCEFCFIPFPKRALLDTHVKTHQNSRPYECFLCKQTFNDRRNLQSHLSEHEQVGLSHCPFCVKVFRQIANLLSHMITHSGLRSDKLRFFECEPCERTFWRFDAYQDHQRDNHGFASPEGADDINFIFDSLMKEVRDPPLPSKPAVFATGANELMCSFCGKEFSRKYTLDRHIKCHTNDRRYKCEVCGVRFIAKYDLTLHLRRHNKEKPFACTICGKAYEVAYRLAGHMKNSKDLDHQNAYLAYSKTSA